MKDITMDHEKDEENEEERRNTQPSRKILCNCSNHKIAKRCGNDSHLKFFTLLELHIIKQESIFV